MYSVTSRIQKDDEKIHCMAWQKPIMTRCIYNFIISILLGAYSNSKRDRVLRRVLSANTYADWHKLGHEML